PEAADAGLGEDARFVELEAKVERRLPAEAEEEGVDALLLDDLRDEVFVDGEEVHRVGELLARLDGGDVRIDEDGVDPLLAQRLERLRSRIIELARLPDRDR